MPWFRIGEHVFAKSKVCQICNLPLHGWTGILTTSNLDLDCSCTTLLLGLNNFFFKLGHSYSAHDHYHNMKSELGLLEKKDRALNLISENFPERVSNLTKKLLVARGDLSQAGNAQQDFCWLCLLPNIKNVLKMNLCQNILCSCHSLTNIDQMRDRSVLGVNSSIAASKKMLLDFYDHSKTSVSSVPALFTCTDDAHLHYLGNLSWVLSWRYFSEIVKDL